MSHGLLSAPIEDDDTGAPSAASATRRWLAAAGITLLCFVYLAVTVVVTGGIDPFDPAVFDTALVLRTPVGSVAAGLLTDLGSWPAVVATALLAGALLRRRTRGWLSPAVLLVTVAVTAGAVFLLKIAIQRPGPSGDAGGGLFPFDYAFPSGHTTDGSVVYVLTALLLGATLLRAARRRLIVGGGVLVALVIGLTRVYLGDHWATDVLAGWFLAASMVCAAMAVGRLLGAPVAPARSGLR